MPLTTRTLRLVLSICGPPQENPEGPQFSFDTFGQGQGVAVVPAAALGSN